MVITSCWQICNQFSLNLKSVTFDLKNSIKHHSYITQCTQSGLWTSLHGNSTVHTNITFGVLCYHYLKLHRFNYGGELSTRKIWKEAVGVQSKCITEYSSMMAFMVSFYAPEGITRLLLALHLFMIFGLLNNSLPCFSVHSHLTPILNLHFSQILSDKIHPS